MLNNTGFDQWADGYDRSVARSDAAGSYPFAGYQEILDAIVDRVTAHGGGAVLDIGFGTGTLRLPRQPISEGVKAQLDELLGKADFA